MPRHWGWANTITAGMWHRVQGAQVWTESEIRVGDGKRIDAWSYMEDPVGGKKLWLLSNPTCSSARITPIMKSEVYQVFIPEWEVLSHSHLVFFVLLSHGTVIPMNCKSFLKAQLTVIPNNLMRWECHVAEVKAVCLRLGLRPSQAQNMGSSLPAQSFLPFVHFPSNVACVVIENVMENLNLPVSSRNPDGDAKPWCHVMKDRKLTWEYCDIAHCCKDRPLATSLSPASVPCSSWPLSLLFPVSSRLPRLDCIAARFSGRSGLGGEEASVTEAMVG